ncbi:MAG: hypothetical protein AABY22_34560, partial [Nanoarchaeota archaeon]
MKKCTTCKVKKILEEFNKNRTTKDGLHSECKKCLAEYRKNHKKERVEYLQFYQPAHKKEKAEYDKQYRLIHKN